jgi:ethanolamine-phosphate phospho-lyase
LNPTTIIAPKPDIFQGDYNDPVTAGVLYANDIKAHMEKEMNEGRHISAFISEPFLGTAGQVPLPEGYLKAVYNYVREAGGLCIIDEVQTGFGRAGTTFWMHQLHDVIPDIVVMGKPVANGHPLSALITRWDIARKFFELNGEHLLSEFFTDCVSLGLAETIFDIIVDEGLQQNAVVMGQYVVDSLKELKHKYHCIGDVRGTGLFIGMEIIRYENEFKYSDGHTAKLLVKKALLEHNVLLKEDGVDHNVIKIKPPLCFTKENADQLIRAIDQSLYGICSN